MERIIQEKISADHLLYVSLKYTKTGDVMLNLINRWESMIARSVVAILEKAKKKKQIKLIPTAPKQKIEKMREIYKKNEEMIQAMDLYEFFKRVENAQKTKENEFRKNVTLKVLDKGQWIDINLDTLKEYNQILERFISQVKQILSK
ncbi:MAG: hypothetical protein ABIE22_02970 [archaeon]